MNRWVTFLLSMLGLTLRGATGDIVQSYIRPDGYSADLVFQGYTPSNSYNFRLKTNAVLVLATNGALFTNWWLSPSATTPRFTVHTPGFTMAGASNYTVRYIYCGDGMRSNYPNQLVKDERTGAGFVTNRVALDDFITAADTVIQFDAPATGVYSNSATVAGLAAANNSTLQYPKPSAVRFSAPGWNLEQGTNMELRAVGFAQWPTNFQPLACLKFIVRGEDGAAYTNIQTRMRLDWPAGDFMAVPRYVANIPLIGFANSNQLRCDVVAYPWRGDKVWTTLDNEWSMPTPYPAAITNFYHTNTYSFNAVVKVDAVGPGRATNQSDPTLISSADYFTNGNAALNAIRGSNSTYIGHTDCGGGTVWYRTGVTNWSQGTATTAGTPKCWVTLKEYPGDTVVWNTVSGNQDISDRIKVEDITLSYDAAAFAFLSVEMMWFKNCTFNSQYLSPLRVVTSVYVTGGSTPMWQQGFSTGSGDTGTSFNLVRGVNVSGLSNRCWVIHWEGNYGTNFGSGFDIAFQATGWVTPPARHQIFYNNILLGLTNITVGGLGGTWVETNGLAFVQNLLEWRRGASSFLFFSAANSGSNVLTMNNVVEGARMQYFYNNTGSAAVPYNFCQGYNDIWSCTGEASDINDTPDGARVGNWPTRWRVGHRGDAILMEDDQGVHGAAQFQNLFNYYPGATSLTQPKLTSTNWMHYYLRNAAGVSANGTGNGNYHVQSKSPAAYLPTQAGLPYDLDGVARAIDDGPGVYVVNPKRGGGFF